MIFFDCRHCGESNNEPLHEDAIGLFAKLKCDKCGKDNYVLMSRIDPIVLTYEEISKRAGFRKVGK